MTNFRIFVVFNRIDMQEFIQLHEEQTLNNWRECPEHMVFRIADMDASKVKPRSDSPIREEPDVATFKAIPRVLCTEDSSDQKAQPQTQSQSDSDEEWWLQWQTQEDQDLGPDINVHVATLIKKLFATPPSINKVKALQQKFATPGNCPELSVPKVNQEIWMKLIRQQNKRIKNRVLRLANAAKAITSAATCIAHILEDLSTLSKASRAQSKDSLINLDKIFEKALDATTLLGHAHHDITLRRREAIRPALRSEYSSICSDKTPATQLLFGDDLEKCMKDAKHVTSLGRDIVHTSTVNQSKYPYGRNRHKHPRWGPQQPWNPKSRNKWQYISE